MRTDENYCRAFIELPFNKKKILGLDLGQTELIGSGRVIYRRKLFSIAQIGLRFDKKNFGFGSRFFRFEFRVDITWNFQVRVGFHVDRNCFVLIGSGYFSV